MLKHECLKPYILSIVGYLYAAAENVGGGEDCPLTKKLVRAVIVSLGLELAVALIVTVRIPPG